MYFTVETHSPRDIGTYFLKYRATLTGTGDLLEIEIELNIVEGSDPSTPPLGSSNTAPYFTTEIEEIYTVVAG